MYKNHDTYSVIFIARGTGLLSRIRRTGYKQVPVATGDEKIVVVWNLQMSRLVQICC